MMSYPGGYGYKVTGGPFTSTTADWVMPTLSCTPSQDGQYLDISTGLDLNSPNNLEEIGAVIQCDPTPTFFGWYFLYPNDYVKFTNPIKAGDSLDASVSYASGEFTLTLKDTTQGWTQTVTKPLAGAPRMTADTQVGLLSSLACAPTVTIPFTGETVDGVPLGSQGPVKLTSINPNITVSPVSGENFTVTCS